MEIGQSSLHQSSISSRKHLKNSIYSSIRKVRRFLQNLRSWYLSRLRLRYGCRSPSLCRGLSSGLKSPLLTASGGVIAFVAAKLSSMADQSGLICLLIVWQTSEKKKHIILSLEMKRKYSKRKTQPVDKLGCKKLPVGNLFRISSEGLRTGQWPGLEAVLHMSRIEFEFRPTELIQTPVFIPVD